MLEAQLYYLAWFTAVDALVLAAGWILWVWDRHERVLAADVMSLVLGIVPLITFAVFTMVFVVGGGSNVAQLAGGGKQLWQLWFHFWPFALMGTGVSLVASLVILLVPPYRRRPLAAWTLRFVLLLSCLMTYVHLTRYFPDA